MSRQPRNRLQTSKGGNGGRGQQQLKTKNKKEKKQLLFSGLYTLQPVRSGPTRDMKVPAGIACKIMETQSPVMI